MAGGVNRKISASSARAHTRRAKKSSFPVFLGLFKKTLVVFFVAFLAFAFKTIQPLPPKTCGSPDGPPITAPRIKLRDGRHLAYKEHGAPKNTAKYRIIYVHGFDNCRHDAVVAQTLSPEIVEDLGVYIVSIDRPGYGESGPDPNRTVKSLALDIEELSDQLGLGSKFYVIGYSMGGQIIWGCLKHIPHRLAGAVLLAPVVNYWWTGFPTNLSSIAFSQQLLRDQWALRVSHYTPWLTYWWNTQKWFPSLSVIAHSPDNFSKKDKELVPKISERINYPAQIRQQGEYESLHRDLIVGFGTWEFSPMDLENPFPNNEGSVHLWQGDNDKLVPVTLQRYIIQKLPWINYHEIPGAGHFFPHADGLSDSIVKSLLVGEK
ncbi:Alpha/beta-Hydrolases superfamily protein [Quillaja saponaria]|uniref:Alpha/beta-Hydrolases superfamily protein n=1 Tax=Quillaja saponaria TaxID=32244 RepID=A0AAD7VD58_QUISA|nr:Alpha/beta-Hydrolases superfamily protein [Quillaja saponaria]